MGIEAEADRVLSREQIVELADAVAASDGIATGIGTNRYGAQLVVAAASRDEAIEKATAEFTAGRGQGGPAAVPDRAGRGRQRGRGRGRMIRLGSLAGYPFEGPRLLGGWTPPQAAAVYAILYKPDPDARPDRYAVIYVDHSDNLSAERFPFQHPRGRLLGAPRRLAVEGLHLHVSRCRVAPASHREPIARELTADLPPALQRPAVRPVLEGRVDRRVRRPHDRPAHQA